MSMLKPATLEDKSKPDKPKKEKKVKSESKPEENADVQDEKNHTRIHLKYI